LHAVAAVAAIPMGPAIPAIPIMPTPPSMPSFPNRRCWFRSMTLPRSLVVSVLAAAVGLGSAGCGASKGPEAATVTAAPGASEASGGSGVTEASGARASAEADREMGPLTLLADPPPPKAAPMQPVSKQGWLGVSLGPHAEGAVINRVVPGSPSERAGLMQ